MAVRILQGDCREVLATLPDASVHMCVTSPPYFGLRDYGVDGQIGLEATPDAFVAEMVAVFREVRRVLRDDGTLWLNLGDSYNNFRIGQVGQSVHDHAVRGKPEDKRRGVVGLKEKDLIGIPWRVAFALQADGWYLRSDIIWAKPNPMPESVTDRPTKAHEYLFLLSKAERYHYDAAAIREGAESDRPDMRLKGVRTGKAYLQQGIAPSNSTANRDRRIPRSADIDTSDVDTTTRNRRTVWTVATQPFSEAHFATFPPALIEPCILAGCPETCCAKCGAPWQRQTEKNRTFESGSGRAGNMPIGKNGANLQGGGETMDIRRGPVVHTTTLGFEPSCSCAAATVPGTVLDPFGGAGTTGLVADRLKRDAILIELNPAYAAMARNRISSDAPLFAEVSA